MAFGRTKEWKFPLFIEAALNYMARGRLREYIAWKQELYKGLPLLEVLLHCLCVFELLKMRLGDEKIDLANRKVLRKASG